VFGGSIVWLSLNRYFTSDRAKESKRGICTLQGDLMKRLCVRRRYGLVLGKDARKRVVIIKAVDFNQNVMRGVNDSG
jgi:hypothetical protein